MAQTQAKTPEQTSQAESGLNINWSGLFSQQNLQLVGLFVAIFIVAALMANQTANDTLYNETASDVQDDVADIGDEALDPLDDIQSDLPDAMSALSTTSSVDEISAAIVEELDEDAFPAIQSIGLHRPNDVVAFTFTETTAEDGDSEWVIESIEADAANSLNLNVASSSDDATWFVGENSVQYYLPMADEGLNTFLWAEVTLDTLNELMAEGAAGEDLFVDTEDGYALLITPDNNIIAGFNQQASPDQISALKTRLTDDNLSEEGYYNIDADPLIDQQSFAAFIENDFNDWQIVGAFPVSEVPSQSLLDSTVNLFDASEVGDTVSLAVADAFRFLNEDVGWVFRGFKSAIEGVIDAIEGVLLSTHWSIIILITTAIAALSGGRQVAAIAAFGMFTIGILGLWDDTMTTLAMLLTSMAFCIIVGIPIGILAARNDTVNEYVRSILDAMQTIHPFVYLVPIAILFGIGTVPGTIATIIFALPPMVRLTNLGIRQVPEDVIEAARAFGSNDWQLLRDVQIPLAMPSIMAGVNQTLMLSLSMVVIVALIAGGGLGQEIYNAIQNQNIGRAVVAGSVVLLLAVVIDRISQSSSSASKEEA